jgi:hypothetical protein
MSVIDDGSFQGGEFFSLPRALSIMVGKLAGKRRSRGYRPESRLYGAGIQCIGGGAVFNRVP